MPDFGTIDEIGGAGSGDLSTALLDQIASLAVDLIADLPIPHTINGDIKYVRENSEYYIYNQEQNEWESIGTNLTNANLNFLRKDENLNDIPNKALARQNLGISAPVDAYTKTETDNLLDDKANVVDVYNAINTINDNSKTINGALVSSSLIQDLTYDSPRHVLFINLTADASCNLPDLASGKKCKFIIENDTDYNIVISSLGLGVLVKGVSSFTLEPHTAETFIFNTNWI